MNKQQCVFKVTFLSVILLCNGISFGMELDFEQNGGEKIKLEDFCKDTLDCCIKPLSVKRFRTALCDNLHKKLDEESVQKRIKRFDKDSPQGKIDCLSRLERNGRKHKNKIHKMRYCTFCSLDDVTEDGIKEIISYESQRIKSQILENERNAEILLVESFGIDPQSQEWQDCMSDLGNKEKFNINLLKQSRNDTTWSCDLSMSFVENFMNVIKETGFKPSAFNIECFECPEIALGFTEPQSDNEPACLLVSSKLLTAKDSRMLFRINHLIMHLLEKHFTRRHALVGAIAQIKNIKKKAVKATCEYAEYMLAQETIADTMDALTNKQVARDGLKGGLFPNSYRILKVINGHLDLLEYFDQKRSDDIIII